VIPGRKKDIVRTVYHERAEEETHHPPLMLFDVALQGSRARTPGSAQNKRDEQMSRAHAELAAEHNEPRATGMPE
jgi:hypothetical protein